MSRPSLIALAFAAALAAASRAAGPDPHMDPVLVPAGCPACHRGHGVSRSPMLPGPQRDVCLSCHGSQSDVSEAVLSGLLSPSARPALLSTLLSLPFVHPLGNGFSRREAGVTCSSCHAPHRGLPPRPAGPEPTGRQNVSTRDPGRLEFELCESCHGNAGARTQSLTDVSRLLHPSNRSYHPVEAIAGERSPSVLPSLAARLVNCTDCHGSADPASPRGPHASSVPALLRAPYSETDGATDLDSAYALCFRCHLSKQVLEGASFPLHDRHVRKDGASCATCHDAHGSVRNRGLVRFGEETRLSGVSPSASGKLVFLSDGPGSGACYLTCHGKNHDPLVYGAFLPRGAPPRRVETPPPSIR